MKRRKSVIEFDRAIWESDRVMVYGLDDQGTIFEVDGEVTLDPAEAVAMMIHRRIDGPWHIPLDPSAMSVVPERCLYWLSGGDREWALQEHYCQPWSACCPEFCDRWGDQVRAVISGSATLGDVRDGFRSGLNLHVIYDWCISRGFVR
jgi:hypothetical protein